MALLEAIMVNPSHSQIMEDIEYYDIPVYNFPYDIEEDDEETIQDNSELRVCLDYHHHFVQLSR